MTPIACGLTRPGNLDLSVFFSHGLGFRVQGLGFRVQGLGFRVLGLKTRMSVKFARRRV